MRPPQHLLLFVLATLLSGCSTPPPASPPSLKKVVYEIPAAPEPAPPEAAPAATGRCKLHSPSWASAQQPAVLRLRPDGAPFARVTDGTAKLTLEEEAPSLEIVKSGVTLRGVVVPGEIALLPARPLIFAEFFVPTSGALFQLRRVTSTGTLGVLHKLLLVDGDERGYPQELACRDVSLDRREFEPRAALGEVGEAETLLFAVESFVLYSEPADKPVATLSVRIGAVVQVVARASGRARILWQRPDELIFGWVDEEVLKKAALGNMWGDSIGDAFGVGGLGLAGVGELPPTLLSCPKELALQAEVEDERQVVGAIAAGTVFEVYQRDQPLTEVHVQGFNVIVPSGARLLADVAGCLPAKP